MHILLLTTNAEFIIYNRQFKQFEKLLGHYYPFDEKNEFCISHGDNYMTFFERMGAPYVNLFLSHNIIAGTAIAVLRQVYAEPVWYICDLKIAKEWRGYFISFKMLIKSLLLKLHHKSTKCYAITMNPADKICRLAANIWTPYGKFENAGNLLIFSINGETMERIAPIIRRHKGEIQYVSLSGIKDILLRPKEATSETGAPLNLIHVNLVKNGISSNIIHVHAINKNATYMFCFHEQDPICNELGITTNVSATILHIGMHLSPQQWDFIQTSEI